jgi:hypothetical protein
MSQRHQPRLLSIAILIALLLLAAQFAGGSAAAAGGPNISISDVTLTEANSGTTSFNFTISLDVADPVNATTVTYTTADNTAVFPSDYIQTSGVVTFPAGSSTPINVTVKVNGDTLNEANETFFVNLTNPSANATILDGQGTGTINNNDTAPKISIGNAVVTEDLASPGGMLFSVTLSAASGQPISVTYATSDGTATAGLDYSAAPPLVLTFAPGEVSKQIAIPIVADTIDEDNETFNVNLTNPVIATLNNTKGVGTINDDDLPPSISIDNQSVLEGNTGVTSIMPFNMSLSAPSGKVVTVKYQTANSTATAPADYTALNLTTLTFQPGIQSQNVNVTAKGDTLPEGDENFIVNLSVPVNATLAKSQGVGTIIDDDALPTISIGDITVAEPIAGSAAATFVVSLSAPSGQPISVNYSTADGSATAGSDYQTQSGLITFNLGETTRQFSVSINSDQLVEPNETFFVNLSSPSNAVFGDNQAIGTITSTAGVPSVSILDKTVTEGVDASAGMIVQLSAASAQPVTVTYAVAGATAVAGGDFQIPAAPFALTFAPGITTQTIAVPILDDTLDESDETFDITLTGATNATVADGAATGTIIDNDPQPTITISSAVVSDFGGTPNAIFIVSLSAPSSNQINVDYQTADGTATAGVDYQAQSGKLTIPAGATSATITISIITDTLAESDETFTVNLGNAVNATLATATGIGTIGDQPQAAPGHLVYLAMIAR